MRAGASAKSQIAATSLVVAPLAYQHEPWRPVGDYVLLDTRRCRCVDLVDYPWQSAISTKARGVLDSKNDELNADLPQPIGNPGAPAAKADEQRVLRLILYDALASEAMGTLTTGVFLVGFAVALGAGNFAIGILAAVPFCVQLLQIPAVLLVERWRARRDICVASTAVGRAFLLGAAAAPVIGGWLAVPVLIVSLAIYQAMAAIAGCAWNSWMRDLVPSTQFGRFFGRRTAATTTLSVVLAFLGGVLIDAWKRYVPDHTVFGYSLLFLVAAMIGYVGVYLLRITPDRPMVPAEKAMPPLALLVAPLREANFRRLIIFLSSWNFAANLAAPFFTVYMLKSLGYPMTTILALTIGSQMSNLAALGLWGVLIDRFSNKAVLEIAAPLFLACTLAWTMTGVPWIEPMTLYLLVIIHVLMGIATAGVGLASGNIAMKLSPAGQATAYLAANSVISAAFAAAAPILGGLSADFFAAHKLTLNFTWTSGREDVTVQVLNFQSWTFFFGIAFILGLYSLHRLSFVEEPSGTTDRLVLREFLLEARRSVHSLSSAAGLLRVVRLPQWFSRPH
jgi:MFS family permease